MQSTAVSQEQFRREIDRVFTMMSEDPALGPRLRAAGVRQRYEFDDLKLVLNVRAGGDDELENLRWEWSDDIDWSPQLRMTMSSETALRYFQGKENVAVAIARRRIRTSGDVRAALTMLPITKPVFARYRHLVETGEHQIVR